MDSNTTGSILLASLTTLSNPICYDDQHVYSEQELYAIELEYNNPESINIDSDLYVANAYNLDLNPNPFENIDFLHFNNIQEFSNQQVVLENDFTEALDALFQGQINTPLKKRF